MTTEPERAGSIYDLGYRSYGGTRLGRRHAVRTVYVESLRSAFGLGRRASSKVIPVILLVIVLLPAAVHLGIAAASRQQMDIVKPEDYSSFVEVILALFVAAQAPELAGRVTSAIGRFRCTSRVPLRGGTTRLRSWGRWFRRCSS